MQDKITLHFRKGDIISDFVVPYINKVCSKDDKGVWWADSYDFINWLNNRLQETNTFFNADYCFGTKRKDVVVVKLYEYLTDQANEIINKDFEELHDWEFEIIKVFIKYVN